MEGVELEFHEDALNEIAKDCYTQRHGSKSLCSIVENIMMDIMYKLPSKENVTNCIITKEVVMHGKEPFT